ncbi:MAG: hypothetical protein LN364_02025, partial [Candidatus Thermoplasmatota archaeon]|nr:hypothetical protein [Candidatus Thermoplasmatota archaeon]
MKKIIPIVVIGVLLISGLGAVAFPETEQKKLGKEETITFPELQIVEENDNIIVNIENANSNLRKIGYPLLPAHVRTYIFPFGTQIIDVDVTFSEPQEYILEKKIASTPEPISFVGGKQISAKTGEIKDEIEIYPESQFSYTIKAAEPKIHLSVGK